MLGFDVPAGAMLRKCGPVPICRFTIGPCRLITGMPKSP